MLQKKLYKCWDVDVVNIVIPNLVKTKTNSKYFIGYLDKYIRPLFSIIPKMSGYVKTIKIEDTKIIESNALPVYDERYMKTKIRTSDNILTFVA